MTCSLKVYGIDKVPRSSIYSEETLSLSPGKMFKKKIFAQHLLFSKQNCIVLNQLRFFVKRRLVMLVINNISVIKLNVDECLINSKE